MLKKLLNYLFIFSLSFIMVSSSLLSFGGVVTGNGENMFEYGDGEKRYKNNAPLNSSLEDNTFELGNNIIAPYEIEHPHEFVTDYDDNTHFQRCTICGFKKEVKEHHLIQSDWLYSNLPKCYPTNYCYYSCECGYSKAYQEPHNLDFFTDISYASCHGYHCNKCGTASSERCYDAKGPFDCFHGGYCVKCGKYSNPYHELQFDEIKGAFKCLYCEKYILKAECSFNRGPGNTSASYILHPYNATSTFTLGSASYSGTEYGEHPLYSASLNKISDNKYKVIISGYRYSGNPKMQTSCYSFWFYNGTCVVDGIRCSLVLSSYGVGESQSPVFESFNSVDLKSNEIDGQTWITQRSYDINISDNISDYITLYLCDKNGLKGNIFYKGRINTIDENGKKLAHFNFIPEIEARGDIELIFIAEDQNQNRTEYHSVVNYIDNKAPQFSKTEGYNIDDSILELNKNWAKRKTFKPYIEDWGGSVPIEMFIPIGNVKNLETISDVKYFDDWSCAKMITDPKYNTTTFWTKEYNFKGDIYSPINASIYARDALGHINFYDFTIDKIDNSSPKITKIDNRFNGNFDTSIIITADDIAEITEWEYTDETKIYTSKKVNKEGSGVYKYFATINKDYKPTEKDFLDENIGNTDNSSVYDSNIIDKVGKYSLWDIHYKQIFDVYIYCIDKVGNISKAYTYTTKNDNPETNYSNFKRPKWKVHFNNTGFLLGYDNKQFADNISFNEIDVNLDYFNNTIDFAKNSYFFDSPTLETNYDTINFENRCKNPFLPNELSHDIIQYSLDRDFIGWQSYGFATEKEFIRYPKNSSLNIQEYGYNRSNKDGKFNNYIAPDLFYDIKDSDYNYNKIDLKNFDEIIFEIYPVFKSIYYIQFNDYNNENIKVQSCPFNEDVILNEYVGQTDPKLELKFLGWNTQINSNDVIYENKGIINLDFEYDGKTINLYPVFNKRYIFKYERNILYDNYFKDSIQNPNINEQVFQYGENNYIKADFPVLDGFTFTGWKCKETGEIFSDHQNIFNLTDIDNKTFTLIPQYSNKSFTIKLNVKINRRKGDDYWVDYINKSIIITPEEPQIRDIETAYNFSKWIVGNNKKPIYSFDKNHIFSLDEINKFNGQVLNLTQVVSESNEPEWTTLIDDNKENIVDESMQENNLSLFVEKNNIDTDKNNSFKDNKKNTTLLMDSFKGGNGGKYFSSFNSNNFINKGFFTPYLFKVFVKDVSKKYNFNFIIFIKNYINYILYHPAFLLFFLLVIFALIGLRHVLKNNYQKLILFFKKKNEKNNK